MRSRRIATLVLVFLFTLPIVVTAADSAQRAANEDFIVRTGQLHEGERFVYDLHAHSTYDERGFHVPAFMEIQIDRIDHRAADGLTYDVVAVHIQQKGEPEGGPRGTVDIQRDVTYYIRVDDGAYIEMVERATSVSWDNGGGDESDGEEPYRHEIETERRWHGVIAPETIIDGDYPPDEQWAGGNMVQQAGMMLFGEVVGGSARMAGTVRDVGEWNGETVYDLGWSINHVQAGIHFNVDCDLFLPTYSFGKTYQEEPAGKVIGSGNQRVWVQPGVALPVVRECDYTYSFDDGREASLHVVLELTKHEPGGEVIPVPTSADEARLGAPVVEGPLTPVAADARGVPTGGDLLEVPLVRALDDLEQTDLPEAVQWRQEGDGFWLVAADYTILETEVPDEDGAPGTPADPLPIPLPLAPGPSAPEPLAGAGEPTPEPVAVQWHVAASNTPGKTMKFRLTYERDDSGAFELSKVRRAGHHMETLTAIGEPAPEPKPLPAQMVPFDDLVNTYLSDAGLTLEQWRGNASSRITINQDLETGVHAIKFTGPSITDDGNEVAASGTFAYDMLHGASLGSEQKVTRDADAPTGQLPIPQPFGATGPTVVDRFPAAATASGIALALGFVAMYFWDTLARVVFAPLYAKVRKDDLLDHTVRDRIVDHVATNPGVAVQELRHELGIGYGTIRHHLDTLARNDLIVHRKVGRRRCYFLPGAMGPAEMLAVGIAGTQAAERVVALVTQEPGINQRDIARRLGVAPSAVRYQTKRLLAHDRVRAEREGRTVRYYPPESAS